MTPTATAALIAAVALLVPPQSSRERLTQSELAELKELVAAADHAMKGEPAADDAGLRWIPHFLRAPDGRTYVPYTLVIDDVPEYTFSSVAMYVRVATRGDRTISTERDKRIGPTGVDVPVFAYDAAAAASARLRLLDRPDQKQGGPYPYEAAHFVPVWWSGDRGPGIVRRALVAPPGSYDLYIAVRERESSLPRGQRPRAGLLKRELDVPDFSTKMLSMSSPIVTETVDPITRPLAADEQVMRPYALGTAEIAPAVTSAFTQADTLSLLFFVYNAAMDRRGKPQVTAEYRFFRVGPTGENEPSAQPVTQRFDAADLPPEFDLRAGHQIVPMQSLPLASFTPGQYRLEIRVTDRIASATTSRELLFSMR
jgi:hypothetical protein